MPLTPKEMVKFLKENGFEIVSQRGSHCKMKNPVTGRRQLFLCTTRTWQKEQSE